jgi:hypothetical protein
MTTLRQKLVRKKNRKLRRLRELYPAVNIKLFYARDFRALMLKYGKLGLVEGLSGSSGQVALPHGNPTAGDPSTPVLDGATTTLMTTSARAAEPAPRRARRRAQPAATGDGPGGRR